MKAFRSECDNLNMRVPKTQPESLKRIEKWRPAYQPVGVSVRSGYSARSAPARQVQV